MTRRAVCINLDASAERWRKFRSQLTSPIVNLIGHVDRVSAYTPQTVPAPLPAGVHLSPASWACYQSHLREIERAIADAVDVLFIFEDDAVFDPLFVSKFPAFFASVPATWDTLYFGGLHKGTPPEISQVWVRCRDVTLHHAWALRGDGLKRVRDHLLDYEGLAAMRHRKHNKDQWCGEGIRRGRFTAYAPRQRWLVGQRYGRSDRNGAFHAPRSGHMRTRAEVSWPKQR